MEKRNIQQHVTIIFYVKFGDLATETCNKLLKAFGNNCMSHAQVFRWHKEFKEGHVEDDARSGRPIKMQTNANAQHIRTVIS